MVTEPANFAPDSTVPRATDCCSEQSVSSVPSSPPFVPSCLRASVPSSSSLLSSILDLSRPLDEIAASLNISLEDLAIHARDRDLCRNIRSLTHLYTTRTRLRLVAALDKSLVELVALLAKPESAVETRRTATAITRLAAHTLPKPAQEQPPEPDDHPDDLLDDDDDDLDEGADEDSSSSPSHPKPRLEWYRPPPPPEPPKDAPPDVIVAHQVANLKDLDDPDATTAFRAIYDTVSLAAKMYGDINAAFKAKLATCPALRLLPADITAQPAVIDDQATPPTATARVTVKDPGWHCSPSSVSLGGTALRAVSQRQAHLLFHLTHEKLPFWPHTSHWRTTAITPIANDTS